MRSRLPKVLHPLAGRPLLWYACAATRDLGTSRIVVVGQDAESVRKAVPSDFASRLQARPGGTADAVRAAIPALPPDLGYLLVVYADTALVRPSTLRRLLAELDHAPAALLTARLSDPRGYGRVFRDPGGRVARLVEQRELREEERAADEVVGGALAFRFEWARDRLAALQPHHGGEYYLTDLITVAAQEGTPAIPIVAEDPSEAVGINDRLQLAHAHRLIYERVRRRLMLEDGVSMSHPESVFVEVGVEVGPDTVLLPNTFLRGETRVGANCVIGPNTELMDTRVGDFCHVGWSVLEGSDVADHVHIGPFSHLRPGARIDERVHLGNFVEVKHSQVGAGTHVGHVSYLGDSQIGRDVNVGAGTITCNYDGQRKHRTVVGDGAFIGSDTMLVAPVTLGDGARTGAGSVVTRDVADHQLVVGAPARPVPGKVRRQPRADGAPAPKRETD